MYRKRNQQEANKRKQGKKYEAILRLKRHKKKIERYTDIAGKYRENDWKTSKQIDRKSKKIHGKRK